MAYRSDPRFAACGQGEVPGGKMGWEGFYVLRVRKQRIVV